MGYEVKISGADLANHLAVELTDLEFELLVRARLRALFHRTHESAPRLNESHDWVLFSYNGRDSSEWIVKFGETYSKTSEAKGEVLGHTFREAARIMSEKEANKLSLLLTGPEPQVMVMATTADDAPF